jgi:hypothetical protein
MSKRNRYHPVFLPAQLAAAGLLFVLCGTQVRAYNATGNEDRCAQLGAACICSEPFNTDTYAQTGASHDPADTNAKQCSYGGEGPVEYYSETRPPTGLTINPSLEPKALQQSLLPNKAAAALWYLAPPDGHDIQRAVQSFDWNVFNVGLSDFTDATRVARRAVRWYVYHSDTRRGDSGNYDWGAEEGRGCQQSNKMYYGTGMNYITKNDIDPDGNYNQSLGTNSWDDWPWNYPGDLRSNKIWTGANNACGPGTDNEWCGNWIRLEVVVDRADGGSLPDNGMRVRMFWKNVTAGTPEKKIMDTYVNCPDCRAHSANGKKDLTLNDEYSNFALNNYRQADTVGSPCAGWRGISHYLVAGWTDTEMAGFDQFSDDDSSFRIEAAVEMEGVPHAPAAPTVERR